jgi:hypothetical protein
MAATKGLRRRKTAGREIKGRRRNWATPQQSVFDTLFL